MKRIAILLFVHLLAIPVMAQMTDDQVIEYVKSRNEEGIDQNQIAKELFIKGVTTKQIQRIKDSYDKKDSSKRIINSADSINRDRAINGNIVKHSTQKEKSKIFGHELFTSDKLTFQPSMNVAAPASYILGPGDEIVLDIFGVSQINRKIKIAPDGSITIPNEGPVYISGLTLSQAQIKVANAIGAHYQESTIKLSIGQTRTIVINVMGEVSTPGTYTLPAFATIFNAIYLAGGITDIGTMRNVELSRNGKVISSVDIYDFIENGRLPGNILLADNDVIIVGTYDKLVNIEGKVKRPMIYEMKKDEPIQSLLNFAGGFTGDAYKDKIRVERRSSDGLTVHNVDKHDFKSFINEDGDTVVVSPIIERYKNTVTVSGAVFRPGNYKLEEGTNTVKTIIAQAGGLIEQAVTKRAVLIRLKEDRTHTTQALDLSEILNGKQQDVKLQNEDRLLIESNTEQINARKLYIYGEVMNPGEYEFSYNTSIEDFISIAGGLTDAATLDNVSISRRITSHSDNVDGNQLSQSFSFNLQDGSKSGNGTDFKLEPFDRVYIHRNPNYKEQKYIYIGGEVLFTGYYNITNNNERISDIVKRAGGLTNNAYAHGAKLLRKYDEGTIQNLKQLSKLANNKKDSLIFNNYGKNLTYSVGIDLEKALQDYNGEHNVLVNEGDSIFIPQMSNEVGIIGAVIHANTVTFIKGEKINYYLDQAGGVSDDGRKNKSYILYENGMVSPIRKGKIEPGCTIIVPSKKDREINPSQVSMWATLASTMASIGAVVAAIVK